MSAKLGLIVFLVGYLFTRQAKTGKAPIENLIPEARHTPLYQILNDPIKWGMSELGDAMSRKGGRSMKWQPISSKRRHKGRKFRGAI